MRAWNTLLFLTGFAAVLLTVDRFRVDDFPYADRIAYFEAHADRYDAVFLGASSMYRGVVPPVFDAAMAERGHPLRTFNLSAPGMRPHEANWLLRRILEDRPERLRWVFLDLRDWSPRIMRANRFANRTVAWHDAAETRSVLRSSLLQEEPSERLRLAGLHLLYFGMNAVQLGHGPVLARSLGAWPEDPSEERREERRLRPDANEIERWQGYGPFRVEHFQQGATAQHRREFLEERETWIRRWAGLSRANAQPGSLASYNLEALEAQVAALRAAGVEPVYLIPPESTPTPHLLRLAEEGRVPRLLAFNDPETYPELYRIENRFDRNHLRDSGARIFSRLLAERFSAELSSP